MAPARTAAALLAPLLLLGGAAAAARAQDYKEQFKDEIAVRGARAPLAGVEVLSETFEKVEWKGKSGPAQSRPASEVLSITYADAPPHFRRGMDAWRTGRWTEAEAEFRGVADAVKAGRSRKFWEGRGLAFLGDSIRRAAAKERSPARFLEAARALEEALKKEPRSPVLDMVSTGLAEARAGGGDWDGAFKALDEFRNAASAAGRPVWEAQARLVRGRLLDRKGESAGAANEFQELATFAAGKAASLPADSPDRAEMERLRVTGLVGRAWALFTRAEKTGNAADADAARAAFERLPSETGGAPAGRAAALNGTGALLLLQGKAAEALRNFIQVEVVLFTAPEEVTRALWYKARALEKLGDAAGREQALRDLVEYYPWSEWAARAR